MEEKSLRLQENRTIEDPCHTISRGWKTVILVWCSVLFVLAMRGPTPLRGDGREYILQTQAIAFDGALAITIEKRIEYWNATNPFGLRLHGDTPTSVVPLSLATGNVGGLYRDTFGELRFYHFWLYSLLVAPLYLLMHTLFHNHSVEYTAFQLFNSCALCLAAFALAIRARGFMRALVMFAITFSPLIAYSSWSSPEIFSWSLCTVAFLQLLPQWCRPLLIAVAATQNPPCALFLIAFPFIAESTTEVFKLNGLSFNKGLFTAYGSAILIALAPILYSLASFGVTNPISALGMAKIEYLSLGKVIDLFASPLHGAVWYFPPFLLSIGTITGRNRLAVVTLAALTLFAALLASTTSNWNSGQVGVLRYTLWLIAPCISFAVEQSRTAPLSRFRIAVLVPLLIVVGITFRLDHQLALLPIGYRESDRLSSDSSISPIKWLAHTTHYIGEIESLVENIRGAEVAAPHQFNEVYALTMTPTDTLVIIPLRAVRQLTRFQVDGGDSVMLTSQDGSTIDGAEIVSYLHSNRVPWLSHPWLGKYTILRSPVPALEVNSEVRMCHK